MYCPGCGKENVAEQRYCRSCGLSLQTISQALAHELSADKSAGGPSVQGAPMRVQQPLLYGFFLLMLGIIIAVFGKLIVGVQIVADIGTICSLMGLALFGYKGVTLLFDQPGAQTEQKALLKAEPTTELPPALPEAQPSSVTEHTTRQFEPVLNKRKAE